MTRLAGKVAIVTGASRGIGRGIAFRLAAEGASTVLTARTEADLVTVADEIAEDGGAAAVHAADLRDSTAPAALVAFTEGTYGRVDIVVNNAGATKRAPFTTLTDTDFEDGFALKYYGALRLTRAAWPQLAATQGSVLNIVGVGGRTPGAQFAVGGSVNAALLALTKSLADVGLADGVQVNAINPGTIRTGRYITRLKALADEQRLEPHRAEAEYVRRANVTRIGEPDDIAALAAFILSDEGRFLHGALIDMDGGATKTI